MKSFILVALCLCAYAHASAYFENNIGDSVNVQLGPQELNFNVETGVITEDDQLLSTELTVLEQRLGRNLIADSIKNLLESFRGVIINGNDVLPPLDPLNVPHAGPFVYTTIGVRVTGNLRNFNLDGLRWYVVDDVTFNTLRLSLRVKVIIPRITATGSYDASARITLLSHSAGGNFRLFLNRLETSVDLRLGTNILGGGTLILRQLDINIVIHDVNVEINGLVGSSVLNNLINNFVQSSAQNLVQNELENISQLLSRELFDIINDLLADFTLDDLLG